MNDAILFLLAVMRTWFGARVLVCATPSRPRLDGSALGVVEQITVYPSADVGANLVGRCKSCKRGLCVTGAVRCMLVVGYTDQAPGAYTRRLEGVVSEDRIMAAAASGRGYTAACACGSRVMLSSVAGKFTEHACNAKCMSSTGPACECSCGGRNHGRAFCAVR